jgi:hypothetical protein
MPSQLPFRLEIISRKLVDVFIARDAFQLLLRNLSAGDRAASLFLPSAGSRLSLSARCRAAGCECRCPSGEDPN